MKKVSRPDLLIRKELVKSKRSQVTIFIIVAILIVVIIFLFFLLRNSIPIIGTKTTIPPVQQEIEDCTKDAVNNAVNIMLPQGGFLNPSQYKLYKGNKIAYLCYTSLFYRPCVNQQPLYVNKVGDEIKSFIASKIEDCFYKLQQDYQSRGYGVDMSDTKLDVVLNPGQVNVDITKRIEINKAGESKKFEKLTIKVDSPIYNLAVITNEIVNQEAKFCSFQYQGYSLLYNDYSIGKIDINGDTKIYNIEDKHSGKALKIAIRSCAFPAGL